ncbi:MAG: TetR/AcrR family transcriptional regulator [Acidimicrobiia bacterium]
MPRVTGGSLEAHRRDATTRVFEAFAKLMYDRGYDAITLADIAEAAGMARTSMYNYYPSKEALLVAYTDREMTQFVDQLRLELHRAEGAIARLQVFVRLQLEYFATHHLPPGNALRDVLSDDAFRSIATHARTLDGIIRGILEEGASDGSFPREIVEDPDTVPLVMSCVNARRVEPGADGDLDATIEATVRFVLRAVGVPGNVSSS